MMKPSTLDDYILQTDFIAHITDKVGKETWLTCYEWRETDMPFGKESEAIYCALAPIKSVPKVMQGFGWDLSIEHHGPGFSKSYINGKQKITYHQFNSAPYLPLINKREFYGAFPEYYEVMEEFRLYHNLYEDKKTGGFSKIIDDSGNTEVVIRVSKNKIEIRLLEIRQFLAAKKMTLVSYFEQTRWSKAEIPKDVGKQLKTEYKDDIFCYTRYGNNDDFSSFDAKSFSRVLGKKIIKPLPLKKCGVWPFDDQDKEYEDFIVGTDESGDSILSTCNKDQLGNNFGANPDAYHFLTPVFFSREVLTKYFSNTEKFELQDGWLYCHGFWSLRLDTNHSNHITVFLGDLCSMPLPEQKHWRAYNLAPEERRMSRAYFERSFLGNFYETQSPDLGFKQAYKNLQEKWHKKYHWDLFLPLDTKDDHYLASLRVPLNDQQSEFDHQVHGLAKVLVDSINVAELTKIFSTSIPENKRGKSLFVFELFLRGEGIIHTDDFIKFLKDLQGLRSTGTAHRKGSNYDKILKDLNVETHGYKNLASAMFYTAQVLVNELCALAEKNDI